MMPPNKVPISYAGEDISLAGLLDNHLGISPDCDEFLKRYVYCRIFSNFISAWLQRTQPFIRSQPSVDSRVTGKSLAQA